MSKKLAILDLDGTLLNTIGDLAACCNDMLAKRGLEQHSYNDYCHFVGNGVKRLVERALPEHLRTEEYISSARKDFVDIYLNNIDRYSEVYDGIIEMLEQLSAAGVTLAVASNKFHAGTNRLIERFFGQFHFEAIYGNREGFPLKPDAALVELIIEECGASREMTYMIGDSGVDVEAAKNGGVRSVGCTWGFRAREELEERGADIIVDRPLDILRVLQ